jgi:hypothetical protein
MPSDLLAEDAVRATDVVLPLGRDRRGLEPEPILADRGRRVVHDLVSRAPASLEREVEAGELELESDRLGSEDADGFLEQLLPCLVPFEDCDGAGGHGAESSD